MTRSVVRSAVASWISQASITGLNQVLTTFPKRINFQVNSQPGQLSRAAGVVFISGERENRIAVGGASNGWKRTDYDVDFQVFHHSLEPDSVDAMTSFDTLIEAIKTQLRAGGHTLGYADNTIIWEAAEPSISVTYGEPATVNGGATETWASVRFTVTQMIQA